MAFEWNYQNVLTEKYKIPNFYIKEKLSSCYKDNRTLQGDKGGGRETKSCISQEKGWREPCCIGGGRWGGAKRSDSGYILERS